MRELVFKNLKVKIILPIFLAAGVIYAVMLTITIPRVMNYTGGMKIPDMMPTGYNAEYISTLLHTMGEQGRHYYLRTQIPLDFVYPLLFAVSLCLLLAFVIHKLGRMSGPLFYISFIPLLAGLSDYFENVGVITMIKKYPEIPESLVKITNVFSIIKSSSTTIAFTLLIILLFIWLIRKIQKSL